MTHLYIHEDIFFQWLGTYADHMHISQKKWILSDVSNKLLKILQDTSKLSFCALVSQKWAKKLINRTLHIFKF